MLRVRFLEILFFAGNSMRGEVNWWSGSRLLATARKR